MKKPSAAEGGWVSTGGLYPDRLPRLSFPLVEAMPELYAPESTILTLEDGAHTHAWLWCYLERRVHGKRYLFNPSSLSSRRARDMPMAIERLSKRYRFDNSRPRTITSELGSASRFMNWLDDPSHQGRYEAVLSDPNLALEALRAQHSYLRKRMQINVSEGGMNASSASDQDVDAIKLLSVVHDRDYSYEIEAITYVHGSGIEAPTEKAVASFMACLVGVFDSVDRIDLLGAEDFGVSPGELRWQSGGEECSQPIPRGTHFERLLELGCMTFAAMCVGDSGANLSPVQAYEEPEDLEEQLARPERLTLRHKVIKFRAGGKLVPVHLTTTTVTRLKAFLRMRELLRAKLGSEDIAQMFVQCEYTQAKSFKPVAMIPLRKDFSGALRSRFNAVGIQLPKVTMQQLRTFKAGKVVKDYNPKVAADMMGHSVSTAIRKYSKIAEVEARNEVVPFLETLTSTVLARSRGETPSISIPPGTCSDHGHPRPSTEDPLVRPDCKKTEGCFFCDKFHVHADEEDSIKLMSCGAVLDRLSTAPGDASAATKVHAAVSSRILVLLADIKRINPVAHERAREAVYDEGRLSHYWASKLQQLHLLGLLAPIPPAT